MALYNKKKDSQQITINDINEKIDILLNAVVELTRMVANPPPTQMNSTLNSIATQLSSIKTISNAALSPKQKAVLKNSNKQKVTNTVPKAYKIPKHHFGKTFVTIFAEEHTLLLASIKRLREQRNILSSGRLLPKAEVLAGQRNYMKHLKVLVKMSNVARDPNSTPTIAQLLEVHPVEFTSATLDAENSAFKVVLDRHYPLKAADPNSNRSKALALKTPNPPRVKRSMVDQKVFAHKPTATFVRPDSHWRVFEPEVIKGGDHSIYFQVNNGAVSYSYGEFASRKRTFHDAKGNNFANQTLAAHLLSLKPPRADILQGSPALADAWNRFLANPNPGTKQIFGVENLTDRDTGAIVVTPYYIHAKNTNRRS